MADFVINELKEIEPGTWDFSGKIVGLAFGGTYHESWGNLNFTSGIVAWSDRGKQLIGEGIRDEIERRKERRDNAQERCDD